MRSERRGGLINCLLGSFRICLIEPSRAGSRRIFVLPQEQKLNAGAWRVLFTQETPAGHAVRKGVACVRRAGSTAARVQEAAERGPVLVCLRAIFTRRFCQQQRSRAEQPRA
jgi:hypothetical protein